VFHSFPDVTSCWWIKIYIQDAAKKDSLRNIQFLGKECTLYLNAILLSEFGRWLFYAGAQKAELRSGWHQKLLVIFEREVWTSCVSNNSTLCVWQSAEQLVRTVESKHRTAGVSAKKGQWELTVLVTYCLLISHPAAQLPEQCIPVAQPRFLPTILMVQIE